MDTTSVVDVYVAAWNERSSARRAGLLAASFNEDGTYMDPLAQVSGRDALVEHIGGFQQRFPDATMERRSRVDGYRDVLRFAWAVVEAENNTAIEGIDFVTVDDLGRLSSVTGFFGVLD
jgi:hypothetical protein